MSASHDRIAVSLISSPNEPPGTMAPNDSTPSQQLPLSVTFTNNGWSTTPDTSNSTSSNTTNMLQSQHTTAVDPLKGQTPDSPASNPSVAQVASQPVMLFPEILAIATPGVVVPPQPQTYQERASDVSLLRETAPDAGSSVNLGVLHRLITSGNIPDPSPHYLWYEANLLIDWLKEMLTVKLNYLLEHEVARRGKKGVIRNIQQADSTWAHLVKWCRRKQRSALSLRKYDDWVPILNTLDLNLDAELRITDMVILITEAYRRVSQMPLVADRAVPTRASPVSIQSPNFQQQQIGRGSMTVNTSPMRAYPSPFMQQSSGGQPSVPRSRMLVDPNRGQFQFFIPYIHPQVANRMTNVPTTQQPIRDTKLWFGQGPSPQAPLSYGNGHQTALGKRKASVGTNDVTEAIKKARQEKVSHASSPAIESPSSTMSSSSPILRYLPNGGLDLTSYTQALKSDIFKRPDISTDIEIIEIYLPPDPSNAAINQWLKEQIKSVTQQLPYLHSLPVPDASDFSRYARCIRFAQLQSQGGMEWRLHPTHVDEIGKRSNWYGMELLRGRTDIAFGSCDEILLRKEFDAVLSMRYSHLNPDQDQTAACIGFMCAHFEEEFPPSEVMDLLTDEDKARFPIHVAAWDTRRATALALVQQKADSMKS